MQSKLHKSTLVKDTVYWYIYQGGGKCQLLMVSLEEDEYSGQFVVMLNDGDELFSTFPIVIDADKDGFIENLFVFERENDAEIMWVHYFVKTFKDNTSVEYNNFLKLFKQLQDEYPDLVLKGL